MTKIPVDKIKEIASKAGAESMSDDAAEEVQRRIDSLAREIALEAEKNTESEKIQSKDIQESVRE